MSWWRRKPKVLQAGSVLFRGRWPARPEDFAFLERQGLELTPRPRDASGGWTAQLAHPTWGQATLVWRPDGPLPSRQLVDWDARLTAEEKALAHQAGSALGLVAEPRTGNVLADRKDLLRFLRAVMGDDGLVAMDHVAQAFWSREGLDDELAHDAELDIDAIHTLHALYDGPLPEDDAERRAFWTHSHGLKEMGFSDFDLLNASPDLHGHAHDLLRALAFAAVEGRLAPGAPPLGLVEGVQVCAVDARAFAAAHGAAHPAWRQSVDGEHLEGHGVVCEPAARGLWARLTGRDAPRASRFLQGPLPDEVLIQFSSTATELMARRARQMLPRLRALAEELADLDLPVLVKLGYATDGSRAGEEHREHLWFEVHGFQGETVDATLLNQPFHVARLQQGQRALHPLELLSDWAIMTPLGRIDPRSSKVLRTLRLHREAFAAELAELRKSGTD